jgi:hypothetical protein
MERRRASTGKDQSRNPLTVRYFVLPSLRNRTACGFVIIDHSVKKISGPASGRARGLSGAHLGRPRRPRDLIMSTGRKAALLLRRPIAVYDGRDQRRARLRRRRNRAPP